MNEEKYLGRGSKTASCLQKPGGIGCVGQGLEPRVVEATTRATSQAEETGKEYLEAKEEWGNHTELSRSFGSARVRQTEGTDLQTLPYPFFQIS